MNLCVYLGWFFSGVKFNINKIYFDIENIWVVDGILLYEVFCGCCRGKIFYVCGGVIWYSLVIFKLVN